MELLLQFKPNCEVMVDVQNRYPDARYLGIIVFFQNLLIVKDPKLIKQILIKEFDTFPYHYPFVSADSDPIWGKNLLLLQGERWKEMRATLSPAFTSSKMRGMFKLFQECTDQLIAYLQTKGTLKIEIELKDAITRFTNDVIASAAFGVSCNSFKNPENEFYLMGKEITNLTGFCKFMNFVIMSLAPKLARLLGLTFTGARVISFFRNLVKTTIAAREKLGIFRPDMLHLLMEARKGQLKHDNESSTIDSGFAVIEESDIGKDAKNRKMELTDDDITSQVATFFFAGFESVSNIICFTFHELAINPDIQQRLRNEIDNTLLESDGTITYEGVLKMKYLDMVLSETLRKWPSIGMTDRVCTKPFTIEPARPGEKPLHLNKGDVVGIPIYSIHHDPQYYPNPDRYDPERFNDENKSMIEPGAFIPFGLGPRSCIGTRFGLLESKLLIVNLLAKYNVVVITKTQIPIKLKPNQFSLSVEKGFWLGFEPRPSQ